MTKKTTTNRTLPPRVLGSLHFLDTNEILFEYRQGEQVHSKYLAHADIKSAFDLGVTQDSNWIQSHVVRMGENTYGKWCISFFPAQILELMLMEDEKIVVPMPATVLIGQGTEYKIWALAQNKFDPKALAYQVPVSNVYNNGSICWGANQPGKACMENMEHAWAVFFTSIFNTHESTNRCVNHPSNVLVLLRKLNGAKKFPKSELLQVNHATIGELVKGAIKRWII